MTSVSVFRRRSIRAAQSGFNTTKTLDCCSVYVIQSWNVEHIRKLSHIIYLFKNIFRYIDSGIKIYNNIVLWQKVVICHPLCHNINMWKLLVMLKISVLLLFTYLLKPFYMMKFYFDGSLDISDSFWKNAQHSSLFWICGISSFQIIQRLSIPLI